MATDLLVRVDDRPGMLAKVGEAMGRAGVNIEGVCAVTSGGKGEIHLLVDDASKARRALEANGLEVAEESDVLVLSVEDRPGTLGNLARRLANKGVNIRLAYLATTTRLVIAADNMAAAEAALQPGQEG